MLNKLLLVRYLMMKFNAFVTWKKVIKIKWFNWKLSVLSCFLLALLFVTFVALHNFQGIGIPSFSQRLSAVEVNSSYSSHSLLTRQHHKQHHGRLTQNNIPTGLLPNVDKEQKRSGETRRAFFLETQSVNELNYRQACSVESFALLNPNILVYVLFMNSTTVNRKAATFKALRHYNNTQLVAVNIDEYVAGTPLEHWYHNTTWREGPYHVSHLSDGLRLLTLAKYGGFYVDLDIIFTQSVTYFRNFIATEDGEKASPGVMHTDLEYPLMRMAVDEFPKNYNQGSWSGNGPELITRMLRKWCGVEKLSDMDYVRCQGFSIISKHSFYPVFYPNWREYFAQRPANDTGKPDWLTDQVIGLHVWNKMSANEPVFKNSTQYYTRFAKVRCPRVFSVAPVVF